jgi:vacuolar-type H+-ATPase subunit E/Vma4
MFKFLMSSNLRKELAEIKHAHKLQINEIQADMEQQKRHWEEDKKRQKEQLEKEHDIKLTEVLSLTKLDGEQRAKRAELEYQEKLNNATETLYKDHYKRLNDALIKLHSEGDKNTKFTQEIALTMLKGMPVAKTKNTTRVITSGKE